MRRAPSIRRLPPLDLTRESEPGERKNGVEGIPPSSDIFGDVSRNKGREANAGGAEPMLLTTVRDKPPKSPVLRQSRGEQPSRRTRGPGAGEAVAEVDEGKTGGIATGRSVAGGAALGSTCLRLEEQGLY